MRRARFCSQCGERIDAGRKVSRLFGTVCAHCASGLRHARLLWVAVFALAAAGLFALGRYTAQPEPFYFIGTRVDPQTGRAHSDIDSGNAAIANDSKGDAQQIQPLPLPQERVETVCGARTKSGRPCRRKVRGGGYCYQHRDKYGPKQNSEGNGQQSTQQK